MAALAVASCKGQWQRAIAWQAGFRTGGPGLRLRVM
jgi:hypothetical protein